MVKSLMTRMEKAVAGTDGDDDERNGRLCGVGIERACACVYITASLHYNHLNQNTTLPYEHLAISVSPSLSLL